MGATSFVNVGPCCADTAANPRLATKTASDTLGNRAIRDLPARSILCRIARFLKVRDDDLRHLHQGIPDGFRFLRIRIGHQPAQSGWHDLPRQSEPVLEPATLALRPAVGQLLPEVIDLLLRLAVDEQRDGFGAL